MQHGPPHPGDESDGHEVNEQIDSGPSESRVDISCLWSEPYTNRSVNKISWATPAMNAPTIIPMIVA